MLKLVFNFSNGELHEGLISVFFSRYCLAVKVEARSRYPKDPFECKNATHNSQLVTKPGEGVLEPTPLSSNCPAPLMLPLSMLSSVEEERYSICIQHALNILGSKIPKRKTIKNNK